jgi:hypothetical protein
MSGDVIARARWARLDMPGRDACELSRGADGWRLDGEAEFAEQSGRSRLSYGVECDAGFRTRRAWVSGENQGGSVDWRIEAAEGEWHFDGAPQESVAGLADLDLAFTPATNLLAIRRLRFEEGRETAAAAAWLDYPHARLMPLMQFYTPLGGGAFRYRAPEAAYEAVLGVHETGFVTEYPGLWSGEVFHA